ncbi:hypothetical protein CDAR_210481 [Caerostris darwini]|uniref:Uncharacterized protein n=1 Tax=Caerostris darwini TaxID=1538125 RepID=A0AAV4MLF1_9ARAC|nr:hypothetical protein CDAR_210481 [Caerostris darwini]
MNQVYSGVVVMNQIHYLKRVSICWYQCNFGTRASRGSIWGVFTLLPPPEPSEMSFRLTYLNDPPLPPENTNFQLRNFCWISSQRVCPILLETQLIIHQAPIFYTSRNNNTV